MRCPTLAKEDQFAEKLLANCDRGNDPATNFRDIFDLGMLILGNGGILPFNVVTKAQGAYHDVVEKAARSADHLTTKPDVLQNAAEALRMDPALASRSAILVRDEVARIAAGH